jgi:hypothetical protein
VLGLLDRQNQNGGLARSASEGVFSLPRLRFGLTGLLPFVAGITHRGESCRKPQRGAVTPLKKMFFRKSLSDNVLSHFSG